MSSGASATRSKKQAKGPRYAKDADVGDWVHIKGIHVTSPAELKRIFGTKGLSKFLSGMVVERMLLNEPGRKGWFYKVEYLLPNGELVSAVNKAIQHFPDKWVDPDPPPESVAHGTITKTIRPPKVSVGSVRQPPSVINFEERNDDDDALSAIVNSQLTEDSALSTDLLPPQSVTRPDGTQPSIAGTTDTSDSSTAALDKPVVKNGLDWFPVKEIVDEDINGRIPAIKWCFLGNDDNYMQPDDDDGTKRSILDYFLSVMPQETIRRVLHETNEKLSTQKKDVLLYPELIRFFGVCILITQFEFETRRNLWLTKTGSKYIPSPNLSGTGMTRHRFDDISGSITFSHQPPTRPSAMSSAVYRWMLVDDFVTDYNGHRRLKFRPSELVRIDHNYATVDLTISNRSV
jgi:Transposase IS4